MIGTIQETLFDELESVSKKPHRIISKSKKVNPTSMPEELYIDDTLTEEATKEVTLPCVECGKQADIRSHGKEFCMEHYEKYFYRADVKLGDFEFI